jgi:hypothetical protein
MRADDSEELLAGYVSGPAAATEATLAALPRAAAARAVVLVEGVSDQIAVETLAARHGRDLAVEGMVVLPAGGVHGMTRYLRRFGPVRTAACRSRPPSPRQAISRRPAGLLARGRWALGASWCALALRASCCYQTRTESGR